MNEFVCHFRGVCHMVWWVVLRLFYGSGLNHWCGRRVRGELLLFADRIIGILKTSILDLSFSYLSSFVCILFSLLHPLWSPLDLDFAPFVRLFSRTFWIYGLLINWRNQTLNIVFCYRARQASLTFLASWRLFGLFEILGPQFNDRKKDCSEMDHKAGIKKVFDVSLKHKVLHTIVIKSI